MYEKEEAHCQLDENNKIEKKSESERERNS